MLRNSRDIIRRLEREGFVLVGVTGSHHRYRHSDGRAVSVPHPRRDIPIGTLFSIYKRASERPVYVIEKNPKLRARQGQYMVTSQEGRVLKRGHELENVLRVLELALVR